MKYFTLLLVTLIPIYSVYTQWQLQASGTFENLHDVAILNQKTAIVVGDYGTILKTTNNGLKWVTKNSGTTNYLNAISFRDEQNGIVVGNEILCKTTDSGESWTSEYFGKYCTSVSNYVWSSTSRIIIGTNGGTISTSTDNGLTWKDTSFSVEPIIAVDFNFSWQFDLAYAAAKSYTASSVFPSNLWSKCMNPLSIDDEMTSADLKYWYQYLIGTKGISGTEPFILKKRWVDTLWVPTNSFVPPPFIPQDISSWDDILFVCGKEGKIFKSADGGDNWIEQFTNITENLNAIDFINDTVGYSVGENGTILFTSNGGISSVEEVLSPSGYYLYQNYPNPFNPTTNIRFKIADRCNVSLVVFDILGKEIAKLVGEEKPAGEYSVEFHAEGLTSGMYFYQLTTKQFTKTIKMLIVR
jgi:hypothetical protein